MISFNLILVNFALEGLGEKDADPPSQAGAVRPEVSSPPFLCNDVDVSLTENVSFL